MRSVNSNSCVKCLMSSDDGLVNSMYVRKEKRKRSSSCERC